VLARRTRQSGSLGRATRSVAVLGVLLCFAPARLARAQEILVSAAASLTDVLNEIAKAYEGHRGRKAIIVTGSSSTLARQIEAGAPADLFISADLAQMDMLENKGLLEPGTRRNLLSNRLVLIVPARSRLAIGSPAGLASPGVKKIALADPASVPVGVYTREYLSRAGLWDKVKDKIIPVLDVRATLASVAAENVEAGFVYKTDAALSDKVKIVFEAPLDKGPKITYPVALIKASQNKKAARDFLDYLLSPTAKATFQRYGFGVRG